MMLHLFLALLLGTAFGLRFPTARIRDRLAERYPSQAKKAEVLTVSVDTDLFHATPTADRMVRMLGFLEPVCLGEVVDERENPFNILKNMKKNS